MDTAQPHADAKGLKVWIQTNKEEPLVGKQGAEGERWLSHPPQPHANLVQRQCTQLTQACGDASRNGMIPLCRTAWIALSDTLSMVTTLA